MTAVKTSYLSKKKRHLQAEEKRKLRDIRLILAFPDQGELSARRGD